MSSDADIFLPLHSRATKHLIECMNDISYLYIPNYSKPFFILVTFFVCVSHLLLVIIRFSKKHHFLKPYYHIR